MVDVPPYPDTGVGPVVGRDREPTTSRPRWVSEIMHSLRASPVFSLVVLVTLALLGLIGVMLLGGQLGLEVIAAMGHFSSLNHRTHDLTYSFLFGVAAVGMLAQLWTPSKSVAGQLMAPIPWVGLALAFGLGNTLDVSLRPPFVPIFGGLTLLATILHPTGRALFSSFTVSRVNWVMLALVIIAAVPLLAFASTNIGLQRTVTDAHATMGHYGYMVAFSFTVIGVGLLASLRPDGWWLPAWVAGLLPALLGLSSMVFPDSSSSLGLVWALAAIAWSVVFVAAAELIQDAENPTLLGSWGIIPILLGSRRVISKDDTRVRPDRGPGTRTPRWANVFGIIALVPILVVAINVITGVFDGVGHGPGRHTSTAVDNTARGDTPGGDTPATSHPTADTTVISSTITPTGKPAVAVVSVRGADYSFDAPDTIAGGPTTLRFANKGREFHDLHLMRFNEGVLIHQFMGTLHQGGLAAAQQLVSVEGGVATVGPGQTADATVDLPVGQYLLICLVPSPDDGVAHALKGMVKPLTVTAASR